MGADDDPECDGVEARDGYLYVPTSYRECVRFQLVGELRIFRTSVGRGRNVHRNDPRDYVAYWIRYEADGATTILAVPHPNPADSPSLFEYYLPGTPFRFTESRGRFAFQSDPTEPKTLVRHGEFVRVV